jgi:phage gpG-like protein
MSLSIQDSLSPALSRIARKVRDRKPILNAMGSEMAKLANGSFNNPAWRAEAWAPNKPSTIAAKLKAGKSSALMKRNLILWRSYKPGSVTNDSVTVSTDRSYAPYLQFGTKRGIPARPMLPFIGGPDSSQLAPWAREKIEKIARRQLALLIQPR